MKRSEKRVYFFSIEIKKKIWFREKPKIINFCMYLCVSVCEINQINYYFIKN
jgi:hypothetical protein